MPISSSSCIGPTPTIPVDRPGEAELIVAKHRSGPTGIVTLTWRKEFMRFESFSPVTEPAGGYFGSDGF